MLPDTSLTPKSDKIWTTIFNKLPTAPHIPKNAESLYSFVANNVDNTRTELREALGIKLKSVSEETLNDQSINQGDQSCSNWEDSVLQTELTDFKFTLTHDEFSNIVTTRSIKRNFRGNVIETKKNIFQPNKWLPVVNEKIWSSSSRKCGYNNINHYVSTDRNKGTFKGKFN